MILNIEHDILVSGADFSTCENHAHLFVEKSQLVHYDSITIDRSRSRSGAEPEFKQFLEQGVAANRRILAELLSKLNNEGCEKLEDILKLPQGFQSKLLHTISHLLDGFFGIDSKLYDIDEDSHWITDNRQNQMVLSLDTIWLIRVNAQLVYGQGFEKDNE